MNTGRSIEVTLPADVYRKLKQEARDLGVPLRYVLAGLVHDTFEAVTAPAASGARRKVAQTA
jgi:hypothetical protein